jgi:hypothetical protein
MRKQIIENRYSKYNYKVPSWKELNPTIPTNIRRNDLYRLKKNNTDIRIKYALQSYISTDKKENRMTLALIKDYFSYCKLPSQSFTRLIQHMYYQYQYVLSNQHLYNNTIRYTMPSLLTNMLFGMRRYIMYNRIKDGIYPKLNNLDTHKAIQLYPYPVMLREESCVKVMEKILDILDDSLG